MCLEDRFLQALYKAAGFTTVSQLATSISLTDTALLSIVHRIAAAYPKYILLQGGEPSLAVAPNPAAQQEVVSFLANGGFTAINEQEFLAYYQSELNIYNKLQDLASQLKQRTWVKWAAVLGFTLGSGLAINNYLSHHRK